METLALLGRTAMRAGVSLLPRQAAAPRQRAWYPTAIAAAAALGLLLLYQGVVNWQSAQQTDELARQVQQEFAQRFPGMARSNNWQAAARRVVRSVSADGLTQWLGRLPVFPDGVVVSDMACQADKPVLQLTLSGSASAHASAQRLLEKNFIVIVEPNGALRLTQREAAQ